jgi:hypothetical protein
LAIGFNDPSIAAGNEKVISRFDGPRLWVAPV